MFLAIILSPLPPTLSAHLSSLLCQFCHNKSHSWCHPRMVSHRVVRLPTDATAQTVTKVRYNAFVRMYTVSHKKRAALLSAITLAFLEA